MQKYKEYSPTPFDHEGAFLPDQGEWLVVPTIQTRDSGPLEESNFNAALALLGGESDTVEVHRFGHWGPGWYEIILVAPDSPQADAARDIEARLDDYPLLDEDDFSAREYEQASETWSNISLHERIELCAKYRCSIFAARRDEIPRDDNGALYEYLTRD
jgi:hypothetical protein